ncbi:arylesterase [Sphingomonas changnyeongensis]|uniref:Arylesterase n=1 Tax=Sphingomonas changnyeongensis TaxID=2698679 RepID=A0A7Z2SAB2_9SPHN|nr:arylesterase [Sphingomonas changnyeongensis]QHL91664.1 arylesterase [Sphingomonas changnyeongensis]
MKASRLARCTRLSLNGGSLAILQWLAACSAAPGDGAQPGNAAVAAEAPAPQAGAGGAVAPVAADARLVVAFGDSLYAGYGVTQTESFPARLQAALAEAGVKAVVHNAGVSGDTSAAGRQRLGFVLDGLPRRPDLVIVGLGGNDMLRGLSPDETRANLTAILDELKQRGIPAMLTGMVAAPNMGPDYVAAFNPIYPQLARQYGVPLYPFFLDGVVTDEKLMQADRIHPTAAGIDRVTARIAPLVRQALAR